MRTVAVLAALFSASCVSGKPSPKSAAVGVRCGQLDVTVLNASRRSVMVELELRGGGGPGGEPARCKMTIERAELTVPSDLLAALRPADAATDVTIVANEVTVLETGSVDSATQVLTFDLGEAVPVDEQRADVELDADEMALVLDAADSEAPLVRVVEAPDS